MTFSLLRRRGQLVPLLCALGVAACDIPSAPPIFEQTWIVPADSTTVGVSAFLPSDVVVNGGGTAFVVTTPAANISSTLGAICGQPACQNPISASVPTPAFSSPGGALGTTITFPDSVTALTVTGGSLQVQVTNNIGFDPLRPSGVGGPFGQIVVGITSGAVSSNTIINGSATQGMANGATTTLNIPLPTGNYASSVTVAVTLTAPAGPAANVASGNTFSLAASLVGFSVSAATVVVNLKPITTTPTEFDLEGVDVGDILQGGGLVLEVVNPFNATADLSVVLAAPAQGGGPAVNINKDISIAASTTTNVNIILLKAELESLLGKSNVTISVTGDATGAGAGSTVSVSPGDVIKVRSKLSLTIHVGG